MDFGDEICWTSNAAGETYTAADPVDSLTRDQLKRLLEWDKADSCVTDDMLRTAVRNRLHLGRLSLTQVAEA